MLKKILFVAAILAVMLPAAAAEKKGTWSVEFDYAYENASGLDAIYAYGYTYGPVVETWTVPAKSYAAGPSNSWSPKLTLAYAADDWKGWLSYYKYSDKEVSSATRGSLTDYDVLFNPLTMGVDFQWLGSYGFPYSDYATATTQARYSRIDANFGRFFSPVEKWKLLFYTGLSRLNVDSKLTVQYEDWGLSPAMGGSSGYNGYGAGAVSEVRINSYSKGWGLNVGFNSTSQIGKRIEFGFGLEYTMARLSRKNAQSEWYFNTSGGDYGVWDINAKDGKMLPVISAFIEADVKITDHFFVKAGYKYCDIKDALSYSLNVNDFPPGAGWTDYSKDFGLDGLYFGLTFKF